jgi:hypothetical protein
VTADEIRAQWDTAYPSNVLAEEATPYMIRDCFFMLREIAAQLAELNTNLKTMEVARG